MPLSTTHSTVNHTHNMPKAHFRSRAAVHFDNAAWLFVVSLLLPVTVIKNDPILYSSDRHTRIYEVERKKAFKMSFYLKNIQFLL